MTVEISEELYKFGPGRACVIVGAAYLEEKLELAIKVHLADDKNSLNKLFKPSGPLGQMATKVELAYLLKIVSKETRDDLLIVCQMRNRFAH